MSSERLQVIHNEFVEAATKVDAEFCQETSPRGIEQFVARTAGGIFRWPCSYADGGGIPIPSKSRKSKRVETITVPPIQPRYVYEPL